MTRSRAVPLLSVALIALAAVGARPSDAGAQQRIPVDTAGAEVAPEIVVYEQGRPPARTGLGRREWVGAAALLGTALLLDRTIEGEIPTGGGERLEPVTKGLNHLGRPLNALAVLGGTWAVAHVADRPGLARSAEHVTVALIASGVVNGTLKYGIGRERPGTSDDPHVYEPFNRDNRWQSFPSGHAVVAFSLAAAVSEEADRPWVTGAAYGTAALVGWSRVYDDKHWASDVVGGAIVGIAVSKAAMGFLHREGRHGETTPVSLTLIPGGVGVSLPAP